MLRNASYVVLVVAFVAFAALGLDRWVRGGTPASAGPQTADELPLKSGFLDSIELAHFASMGYRWQDLRADVLRLKRELPPDPQPTSAEDTEKANIRALLDMPIELPAGRIQWGELLEAIRRAIEPQGVKVTTRAPRIPDSYPLALPRKRWKALEIFGHLLSVTKGEIVYHVTCEGVIVGTDEAVNRGVRDAGLGAIRRRLTTENLDAALDVEFRPQLVNANIVAFADAVKAQTGVDVVVDVCLWERGPVLAWRGEPRKLRDALDELCQDFHWFWRYHDGRVWLCAWER